MVGALKEMVRSWRFFLANFFVSREYDIVFYYPAHFNRGEHARNGFFEPLYRLCEIHGLRYIAIEEPINFKRKAKRNPEAIPFDGVFYPILLARKLLPLALFPSFQHREWFIASIFRPFFFRKFHFRNYIVLSNSMLGFFRGLESNASLYDYQHGVIFSGHTGYFKENYETVDHIKLNRAELLLYGKGFQEMFEKFSADGYYKTHTHVLGYDAAIRSHEASPPERRCVLFTLQFTGTDEFGDKQEEWREIIYDFFDKHRQTFLDMGISFYLKKHPRHDPRIDLSPLFSFPFVHECRRDIGRALESCPVHLTFYSSSLFDASAAGKPTLLWQHDYSLAHIFVDNFDYPLGTETSQTLANTIIRYFDDPTYYSEASRLVAQWYTKIYSPLDTGVFERLFVRKAYCPLPRQDNHTSNAETSRKILHRFYTLSSATRLDDLFYFVNSRSQRVITYHNVIPDHLFDETLHLGVSHAASIFEKQIRLLTERFESTTELGKPGTCIVTFDDGFLNNFEVALPILRKYGVKAYFFIPTESLEQNKLLWIDEILRWLSYAPSGRYRIIDFDICLDGLPSRQKALCQIIHFIKARYDEKETLIDAIQEAFPSDSLPVPEEVQRLRFTPMGYDQLARLKEEGHKIGCHSHSHEILSKLSPMALAEEIKKAEAHLDDVFNTPVYSYPFGGPDEVTESVVQSILNSRFEAAFVNIDRATENLPLNRFALPRTAFPNIYSRPLLEAKLSGLEHFLRYREKLPEIGAML